MTSRRNLFIVIVILGTMLIANFLIMLTNIQNMNYVTCGNTVMTKGTLDNVSQIIRSVSNMPPDEAVSMLEKEAEQLQKYCTALNLTNNPYLEYEGDVMSADEAEKWIGRYSMTASQAESKQRIIALAIDRLNYVRDYPEYITDIRTNVQDMMSVSIFNNRLKNGILTAEKKYFGFENMIISAEQDTGINILFTDRITDILCIVTMLACSWLYIVGCQTTAEGNVVEKNKLPLFVLLISSAIILMYVENAVIVNNTFGLGDLNRSVQSVWNYIACPYKISTGTLTVFRVLSKLSGCLTIFFLSSVFLSSDSRFRWCVVLFPVLAELCMHLMKSSQHIFSIFSPEKLIRDYNFCSIYGIIVDYTLIFEIITVLLLAFSSVWSSHTVEKMLLNEKNLAERRYYDEINEKYNETRMIRHDIKNHLTAVAILIDDGKIDDARKYLDDISSEMDRVRPPVNTGSLVLDSLLFRKASDMKKKKIELVIAFLADFSKCPVSEYDLCSIFGNILDNAMEATEKLPDEKRCIHLTVKRQLDMICIICENPFEQINEDLSTQKSDKAYHGFGLKRIRRIAENYSGDVRINSSDSIFRISVLLNTGTEK